MKALIVLALLSDDSILTGHSKQWDSERAYLLAVAQTQMSEHILESGEG